MPENDRLLPLAGAVADGQAVNWAVAEAEAQGEEERRLVRHLRLVANVGELHRSIASLPLLPVDESDGETLAGPPRPGRSPAAPKTWGPLSLIERVGSGTSGDVWRAWDTRLDRHVALKLYRVCEPEGSAVVQEGRLLARVRHTNVVTVHGAERIEGQAGLWMEFIDGRTLADLVASQGPFGAKEAVLIGLDLCRALAATHRSGLVHGDVKANNVMREEGGRIVLMDLSAAKEAFDRRETASLSGTPLYMAPELLRNEAATFRSDIYSLGVLLYYLVSGAFPVRGMSLADLARAHERGERQLLRDLRPDLPAPFVRVIEKATASDLAERFESAGRMEAELAQAVGLGVTAKAIGSPFATSRGRLLGLAAILVMAAIVAWMLRPAVVSPPGGMPVRAGVEESHSEQPVLGAPDIHPRSAREAPEARRPEGDSAPAAGTPAREKAVTGQPSPAGAGKPDVSSSATEIPYAVQAAFHRHEEGADIALLPGARVAPGDRLFLEFQASTDVHLYVVNEDQHGTAFLLFPLPGQDLSNPLPGGIQHRLPGPRASQPVYWQVTSQGGRERFLLVASPQPLPEIEAEVVALARPEFGQLIAAPLEPGVLDRIRGVGGLVAGGSRAAGEPGRLARLAQRLALRAETVRGTWIRQFDLEN